MGNGLVNSGGAGASATAEYRRAQQKARPRRLVRGACAVAAIGFLLAAVLLREPGLAAAGIVAGFAAWLVRPDPDADRWRRGAAGEVATAAILMRLSRRYVVLHDRGLPGTRANVDHLVVGPSGVWVIDTKAYQARLRIRAGTVWAGRYEVPTAPAAWEAEQVSRLLGVPVRALVVVHGTGLRRRGKVVGGVRILPAPRVGRRLRRGPRVLSRAAIVRVAEEAATALPPASRR